jgi:chromosome segregation ATPase
MNRLSGWIAAVSCIVVAAVSDLAVAQTARSGGNASAQLMQQMQQLASERTTLQGENDKLKKQLADITKDRDALKSGQQVVERRAKDATVALEHSDSQRAAVDQELTQTKAKMQELITRFRETIVQLRNAETEGTNAKHALATRERELSTCVDRNVALYKLNDEVLTHYEKQSAFARMAQIEEFTRIKRTQNENLIDEYRARAQDQVYTRPAGLPPASAPSGAASAPQNTPPAASPTSAVPHAAGAEPQVSTPAAVPGH